MEAAHDGFCGGEPHQIHALNRGEQESGVAARGAYMIGWDSYRLLETSLWGPSRRMVSEMLKKGAEMGLIVCRTWAFHDIDDPDHVIQLQPAESPRTGDHF